MDKIIINNSELTSLTYLQEQISSLQGENKNLWNERKELFLQQKRLNDMIICYEEGLKDLISENSELKKKIKHVERELREIKKKGIGNKKSNVL